MTLRERYAAGNLDDEEFERMLDVLLSTETPGDARDHRERSSRRERERLSETPAR
ncbi:SHOCT domain-containing protein [Haloprofundus salinisoli]|uniref:SHOCT domain-containing protein n=1 Tax=Haloprofundus salinisoli TaxID=2876193 RepID=UPI0031F31D49